MESVESLAQAGDPAALSEAYRKAVEFLSIEDRLAIEELSIPPEHLRSSDLVRARQLYELVRRHPWRKFTSP